MNEFEKNTINAWVKDMAAKCDALMSQGLKDIQNKVDFELCISAAASVHSGQLNGIIALMRDNGYPQTAEIVREQAIKHLISGRSN